MTRKRTYGGRCTCVKCFQRVSFGVTGFVWHHKLRISGRVCKGVGLPASYRVKAPHIVGPGRKKKDANRDI